MMRFRQSLMTELYRRGMRDAGQLVVGANVAAFTRVADATLALGMV